jgi:hypothetical protein
VFGGPVKVNVVVLIVAGFIALLNVAVIRGALLGQRRVPFGVTESAVGGVSGSPAPPVPAFLSGSLHPIAKTASRNAEIQILLTFNLRISFSSSHNYMAFQGLHRNAGSILTYGIEVCTVLNIIDVTLMKTDDCSFLNSSGRNLCGQAGMAAERSQRPGTPDEYENEEIRKIREDQHTSESLSCEACKDERNHAHSRQFVYE